RTPAAWQTFRFVTKPAPYMRSVQAKYGDIATFRILLGEGVGIMGADLAREVFAAPPATFEAASILGSLFGAGGVIAVSGDRHKKLRKLLNLKFHGAQVKAFLSAMQRAIRSRTDDLARAARTGQVVVMSDFTQSMALDIILETVFGAVDLD